MQIKNGYMNWDNIDRVRSGKGNCWFMIIKIKLEFGTDKDYRSRRVVIVEAVPVRWGEVWLTNCTEVVKKRKGFELKEEDWERRDGEKWGERDGEDWTMACNHTSFIFILYL